MDMTILNETSLKLVVGFAIKNTQEDFNVTQCNSSIVHEIAKLNIKKASNKIDRKALKMFNGLIKSS